MNATLQAQTAYRDQTSSIRTGRSLEYEAFARITYRLKAAAEARDTDYAGLVAALHDNRRLWTVLAVDVADGANALPRDLRARIISLAEFTRQHSSKVLNGQAKADALIEINTAVMRGLDSRTAVQ